MTTTTTTTNDTNPRPERVLRKSYKKSDTVTGHTVTTNVYDKVEKQPRVLRKSYKRSDPVHGTTYQETTTYCNPNVVTNRCEPTTYTKSQYNTHCNTTTPNPTYTSYHTEADTKTDGNVKRTTRKSFKTSNKPVTTTYVEQGPTHTTYEETMDPKTGRKVRKSVKRSERKSWKRTDIETTKQLIGESHTTSIKNPSSCHQVNQNTYSNLPGKETMETHSSHHYNDIGNSNHSYVDRKNVVSKTIKRYNTQKDETSITKVNPVTGEVISEDVFKGKC